MKLSAKVEHPSSALAQQFCNNWTSKIGHRVARLSYYCTTCRVVFLRKKVAYLNRRNSLRHIYLCATITDTPLHKNAFVTHAPWDCFQRRFIFPQKRPVKVSVTASWRMSSSRWRCEIPNLFKTLYRNFGAQNLCPRAVNSLSRKITQQTRWQFERKGQTNYLKNYLQEVGTFLTAITYWMSLPSLAKEDRLKGNYCW